MVAVGKIGTFWGGVGRGGGTGEGGEGGGYKGISFPKTGRKIVNTELEINNALFRDWTMHYPIRDNTIN